MKYTERRTMTAYNLRSLCIKKNWYTRGDVEQYSNMLNMLTDNRLPAKMTTERLAQIAADILAHSDADDCSDGHLEMTSIMYDLAKACDTVFIEH